MTAETSTAAGSPPVSEPVTGWVTESDSAEAAEVVPLDLEDLGAGIELESSPLEGIQVEQPTSLGDTVEPIAGLVGRDDHVDLGSFDHVTDFRVETAEDIILNSSGGSEFQVANAAEELLGIGDTHEPAPSLLDAAPDLEPTSGASVDEHAGEGAPSAASDDGLTPIAMDGAERTMFEAVPPAGPEPAPEEPITAEANVPDWALEPLSIEDDRPAEPASTSAEWTPPWSRQREPEPAPVPEPVTVPEPTAGSEPAPSAPEPWASPAAEPPREAEPDLVVTASMAELLLQQGHAVEALTVYRLLETRAGGASRYGEKIAELERLTALPETPAAPPQPVAPTPAYSVLETKGQSVQAFLRTVLTARPAAVAPSAAVHAAPSRGDPASAQGAPTRPAHDSLSLSSVFGEESTPTLPAVPAAGSGAPPAGVSYDEFFGGGGNPAAPRQPRASDSKSDDLDQFHAWLQNLKR